MLIENLKNKIFIGTASIPDKYLSKEKEDYLLLTLDNVNENSFFCRDNDSYISYKKLRKLNLTSRIIQYGDFLIFRKAEKYFILRYDNQLGTKVIPTADFIVLRTVGGNYFKNFVEDIDGRLYFLEKLNRLYKQYDDAGFIKNIEQIDIPLLSEIKNKEKDIDNNIFKIKKTKFDPSKINLRTEDIPIATLINRIERNAIDMSMDFRYQGNNWDIDTKSKFIESLLIKLPVPELYLDCSDNKKWIVLDGFERLNTLKQFVIEKKLALHNLEFLTHLNGKKYVELSIREQAIIEESNIKTIQILAGTPAKMKYSLIERINRNLQRTPQELRHAINSANGGKPAKYVKQLADEKEFKEVWADREKDRMQDRETVLSYIAFRITDYKTYHFFEKKKFLDEMITAIYEISKITLDEWLFDFRKALITAKEIFGIEKVFKRPVKSGENEQWRFSTHLFEIWTYTLATNSENTRQKLLNDKVLIARWFFNEALNDEKFIDALNNKPYSPQSVTIRFGKIVEFIKQWTDASENNR